MKFDLIVLGGGPAGYNASEKAAHAGLSVLCIEKNSLGGVCLNEGCIPTKTLLYSAKLYDGVAHGDKYGVTAENLTLDHKKVVARKNKVVKLLVGGVKSTLKAKGVTVIMGEGKIMGKSDEGFIVKVGEEEHIGAKLLIAAGSVAAVPPIPGLKEGLAAGYVVTNREILSLDEKPEKLVVIGGGVIGLEMASYFNSIGTEVNIVEMLDHIGGANDAELTSLLQKNYERKGMKFILGAKVTEVKENEVVYELNGEIKSLVADKILLSIGRRAASQELGLENIGVEMNRGAVVTDEKMRTNVENVYAAGDINGNSMLAHTAYREGEVAVNNILGKDDTMNYNAVPSVIYTNPELASVGETEATAKEKGIDYELVKLPMRYSGRYLAENEGGDGVFKLLVDKKSKVVLGVQALSNYASEFIVTAATFVEKKMTVEDVKTVIFPHPTVGEIIREAIFQCEE